MRYAILGALLLALGCGDDDGASLEAAANNAAEACTQDIAARFFSDATQVDYDYDPQTAEQLAAASTVVLTGHVVALRIGPESSAMGDESVITELVVDKVYMGVTAVGAHVFFRLARAGSVEAAAVAKLSASLPRDAVTVFLDAARPTVQRPAELAAGDTLYELAGVQGLLVSNTCGVAQPLADAPLFSTEVSSTSELDAALQRAVR